MRSNSEVLGLPRGSEMLLRELVHERTGIFFDDAKIDILLDKLSPLVVKRGLNSFLDYYYLLKYDENAVSEWRKVMNAIAVGETYFWRETDQVRALTSVIVPDWFAANPGKALRIWSAACASGEEPLTIAIALEEAGWFDRAPIEIVGSDANSAAIEKANLGIYRERSFRNLSPDRRQKYFSQEDATSWRVRDPLRSRVRFSVANLMNEIEIEQLAGAQVVFCRNVFIYFSEATIGRVVQSFSRLMPLPGYLLIGTSESLLRLKSGFALEEIDGAFVYVKECHGA